MRLFITLIATIVLAGCASTPPTPRAVYDNKSNLTRTVAKAPSSEFVGTGAATKALAAKPSWYAFGHP